MYVRCADLQEAPTFGLIVLQILKCIRTQLCCAQRKIVTLITIIVKILREEPMHEKAKRKTTQEPQNHSDSQLIPDSEWCQRVLMPLVFFFSPAWMLGYISAYKGEKTKISGWFCFTFERGVPTESVVVSSGPLHCSTWKNLQMETSPAVQLSPSQNPLQMH